MDTIEQQALDLIERFYNATYKDSRAYDFKTALMRHKLKKEYDGKGLEAFNRAKDCAIISINIIIEGDHLLRPPISYFEKLKKAIEFH